MLVQQVGGLGVGRVEHHLQGAVGGLGQLHGEAAEVLGAQLDLDLLQALLGGKADGVGQICLHVGLLGVQLEVLAYLHGSGLHVLKQGLIPHHRGVQIGIVLVVGIGHSFPQGGNRRIQILQTVQQVSLGLLREQVDLFPLSAGHQLEQLVIAVFQVQVDLKLLTVAVDQRDGLAGVPHTIGQKGHNDCGGLGVYPKREVPVGHLHRGDKTGGDLRLGGGVHRLNPGVIHIGDDLALRLLCRLLLLGGIVLLYGAVLLGVLHLGVLGLVHQVLKAVALLRLGRVGALTHLGQGSGHVGGHLLHPFQHPLVCYIHLSYTSFPI